MLNTRSMRRRLKWLCLLVFSFLSNRSFSQQPGGVDGTIAWFQTEKHGLQAAWLDVSGNHYTLQTKSNTARNINFHNALSFNDSCLAILSNAPLEQVYFLGAFYPDYNGGTSPAAGNFYTIGYNGAIDFTFGHNSLQKKGVKVFDLHPDFDLRDDNVEAAMKTAAQYDTRRSSTSIWGEDRERKLQFSFKGFIPELIVYNRVLTPVERQKVETYLAIKYSLTLDLASHTYLSPDGNPLLEEADMGAFKYRICGIGKDATGALFQPQSNTTYEETNNAYTYNADGTNARWQNNRSLTIGYPSDVLSNKITADEFLFWGDNGALPITLQTVHLDNNNGNLGDIELVTRNWQMFNKAGIKENTRVSVSGLLKEKLDVSADDAYFLLKLAAVRKRTDFYPLLPDGAATLLACDTIGWKGGNEQFTVGRVKKLKFVFKYICADRGCPGTNDEYIYKPRTIPIFSHCNFKKTIGYQYRNSGTKKLTQCDLPSDYGIIAAGELEVYFEGGIGPYSYSLKNAAGIVCKSQEDALNYNKTGVYRISSGCTGSYILTIRDFTNQSISLPINIQ